MDGLIGQRLRTIQQPDEHGIIKEIDKKEHFS